MSFSPLITDLTNYTNTQLESKIVDLQLKYFQTQNPQVRDQIITTLNIYKEELSTRQAIAAQRQREKHDGKSDLDGLINIS